MSERNKLPPAADLLPDDGDLPDETSRRSLPEFIGFAMRLAGQHPWRFALILAGGLAFTTAFYVTRTPLYRSEAKFLTQRQQAMPSISRAAMSDEAPTRTANDLVRQRENLLALLNHAGLLNAPEQPQPEAGWRRLFSAGATPQTPEDSLEALVLRLDRSITVTTGDGTISISVDWPNAMQAYSLVEGAYQNFLESRQVQEITAIDESIGLLKVRAAELQANLDRAIVESQGSAPRRLEPSTTSEVASLPAHPSESLVQLRAVLDAKSRALRDVEELRNRRLAELQGQLLERSSVLSDAHPTVIALKGEIQALSRESPQVTTLRQEESRLQEQYASELAAEAPIPRATGRSRSPDRAGSRQALAAASTASETEKVRDARLRYTQILDRLSGAQLELDSARAAFRHRYKILWPAQVPRKAVSPNPIRVFGAGSLLSLFLAFASVIIPYLRSGLITERWQVERSLGLSVLAEFPRK
jgi:hypothetical protein